MAEDAVYPGVWTSRSFSSSDYVVSDLWLFVMLCHVWRVCCSSSGYM